MDIWKRVLELEDYVIECRRWLHQHAELPWQEFETCEFIAGELRKMGLEPQFFEEGRTGMYAMIYGGKATKESKTIMLRADIDALPIPEEADVPFRCETGNMHACGHDSHVAMLLGATKILLEMKEELKGNVKIFFQGAEETANGAEWYVKAGILDDVDAVYACHVAAWLDSPYISVDPGPRTAACDEFHIHFTGVGCHGGMPHFGKDAAVAASATVMNLQTIVSRMTDSLDALVITVGKIEAGTNYNVVANYADLRGTVRSYSPEVRAGVPEKMREVAEYTAKTFGCRAEVNYTFKTGAVRHTDPLMNKLAYQAVEKLFGADCHRNQRPIGGGDDFAYFSEQRPGIFAMIGARNAEKGCVYDHHHPKFNIDEASFKRGTAMFVQMAADYLAATAE